MNKKILIIEDEESLTKALVEGLKENGNNYEVTIAIDGEEGLAKAKEIKPDLVLLDLILPKIDGFTVLKELKDDVELKDTKVVVLTNLSDVADKVLGLGATDCLIKSDSSIDQVKDVIRGKFKE